MTKKKFPLFPSRLSHKGKNKGKYISFHYLRGWKAYKIRKVQEISPQLPIFNSTSFALLAMKCLKEILLSNY